MNDPAFPIPSFALYGEGGDAFGTLLHIETIATRSVRHDWEIATHRHPNSIQLLLVLNGQVQIEVDGARESTAAPFYLCIPQGIPHGFRFDPGTAGFVITLSVDFLARLEGRGDPLLALLTEGGRGELPAKSHARIQWLAQELIEDMRHWPVDTLLAANLFEAMLRCLPSRRITPALDARLSQFLKLVEEHMIEHRPISFYAARTGTSPRNFARLCAAQLGCSPQQAVNRRLAAEADRMLRHTSASVAQVCDALGFRDLSYFSRFFQREAGRRPSEIKSGSGRALSQR